MKRKEADTAGAENGEILAYPCTRECQLFRGHYSSSPTTRWPTVSPVVRSLISM
jgi:hypothetical protein